MNIIPKSVWRYLAQKAASSSSSTLTPMSPELARYLGGGPTNSGKVVNEANAMTLSAVWACVRTISEAIGSIPWAVYKRDAGGNSERDDSHPLASLLLRSPNADMTSVEFREALSLNLCRSGNAYSFIDRLTPSTISSLYPLESSGVIPKRKRGGNTKLALAENEVFYSILDRGAWVDYPREKVWHVKGFGANGLVGLSPLAAARETLGFALATEEFGAKFFMQGGKPSGVVSTEKWLTKEQRVIARENLTQMLGGNENAHKFALFEGGMKPTPWGGMPLNDMEFVMVRRFSVQDICRFYRIPPHMVADLEKGASFASIEQMSSEFVTFTLLPYLTRLEAAVSRWLLPPAERDTYYLRFNYEGLLRADSKGRSEFYASAVQNGWMTRNEVRAKENLNRADGLDGFTAQVNLAPVESLGEAPEPEESADAEDPTSSEDPEDSAAGDKARKVPFSLRAVFELALEKHLPAAPVAPSALDEKAVRQMALSMGMLRLLSSAAAGAAGDSLRAQCDATIKAAHEEHLAVVEMLSADRHTGESVDSLRSQLEKSGALLAASLARTGEGFSAEVREMAEALRNELAKTEKEFAAKLADSANKKRRLVLDPVTGDVIGSEPVDEL